MVGYPSLSISSYLRLSVPLSRVFLKLENLQPSASFKSRGMGQLILSHLQSLPIDHSSTPHFYSSSGGNAGLGTVVSATALGYPASVVVPLSTSASMIAKLRLAGAADVIQVGESWVEADAYLREVVLRDDKNGVYVPPFDHEEVWRGNATIVKEVRAQLRKMGEVPEELHAMVCSVGGGGLLNGVVQGLDDFYLWHRVDVVAVETKGAESLYKSLQWGELVTLKEITSIATSLGAKRVSQKTFENGCRKNVHSVVVSDAVACMGSWRFADDERMMVEPACGASLALCYDGRLKKALPHLTGDSMVVIVVCGGSKVTVAELDRWREDYRQGEEQATKDEVVPSTNTAPKIFTR